MRPLTARCGCQNEKSGGATTVELAAVVHFFSRERAARLMRLRLVFGGSVRAEVLPRTTH